MMLFVLVSGMPAGAETVIIEATRDATLIEHPDGALANGSGPRLFAGRTGQDQNGTRRVLLHFDVARVVPRRAIIETATLTLYMTPSNPETRTLRLQRVLADWGEGPSSSSGGSGAESEPGDATWVHSFYDSDFWVHGGGQFVGRASAELEVAGSGLYTWGSDRHLVHDVRLWRSASGRNFGWILIGDETERQSVKSFASRESPDLALRPMLEVTYRLPGDRGNR